MSYRIKRCLPEHLRTDAARLYWSAFGAKLGRVLAPEDRALHFIARAIDPSHVYCAISSDGELLGVAGFRTPHGTFVGCEQAHLRASYGRPGGMWRMACLAVLGGDHEHRAMIVDGISVRPDMRGSGIGAALIEALCHTARRRGYGQLRLDVVAENTRARALYERIGFVVTHRRSRRLTAMLFRFRTVLIMRRDLGDLG